MISLDKVRGLMSRGKKIFAQENRELITVAADTAKERFQKKAFFFISIPLALIIVSSSVDTVWAVKTTRSKRTEVQSSRGHMVYDVRPALSPLPWRDPFKSDSGKMEGVLKEAVNGDVETIAMAETHKEDKGGRSWGRRVHGGNSLGEGATSLYDNGYKKGRREQKAYVRRSEGSVTSKTMVPQVLGRIEGKAGTVVLIKVESDTVALRPGQRYRDLAVLSLGEKFVKLAYKGKVYEIDL